MKLGIGQRQYKDCAVRYVRHSHAGYGIFHCDSMKYEKEYTWHVPAMKFIGMKQLGLKRLQIYLKKLRFMWMCGILGNFVKIWYFVNNCLIKVWI